MFSILSLLSFLYALRVLFDFVTTHIPSYDSFASRRPSHLSYYLLHHSQIFLIWSRDAIEFLQPIDQQTTEYDVVKVKTNIIKMGVSSPEFFFIDLFKQLVNVVSVAKVTLYGDDN